MIDRRGLLLGGSVLLAAGIVGRARAQHEGHEAGEREEAEPTTAPARGAEAQGTVVTPNVGSLPYRTIGGAKVWHLIAEPVQNVFCPGLEATCWGYNGSTPGPTIEAVEGDRARIFVTNRLPEPTSVHWHGQIVPSGMDGVGGLSHPPIPPGQTFVYEFEVQDRGTFMYHSHFDEMVQIAMGMQGLFVVHPRGGARPDRDYALMLSEWFIEPGQARPDPLEMSDFNVLTMNGKAFPATEPLVAETGERVRIRLANLGPMNHHPIHLHGHHFRVVATDGGPIPRAGQWPENTVLVPVGATRDIEFVANPGDWAFHCHMTHHVMNQMGHDFPNMIGARTALLDARMRRLVPGYMSMGQDGMSGMATMRMPYPENSIPMLGAQGPYGVIDMGGMMTILKVRERIPADGEVGWYEPPRGTVAHRATDTELREAGIEPSEPVEPSSGHRHGSAG
jgi:FtsP/CotA-like multicopper oxidase with cupredoxin domain